MENIPYNTNAQSVQRAMFFAQGHHIEERLRRMFMRTITCVYDVCFYNARQKMRRT